jgi:hypothetical protein
MSLLSPKMGRGDLVQTLHNIIKVCQLNGYTTNINLQVVKLSILYFKIQHKEIGFQGIISLLICSQEPTGHECGSSFVIQQHND